VAERPQQLRRKGARATSLRSRRAAVRTAELLVGALLFAILISPAAATAQTTPEITRFAKLGLIDRLKSAPRFLIFGSSRAMRADPAYLRRRLGVSGFNAAVSSGCPADAWAYLNAVMDKFGPQYAGSGPRCLWMIDLEQFHLTEIHARSLSVKRLADYIIPQLPPAGRVAARSLPPMVPGVPVTPDFAGRNVYATNGFIKWSHYDWRAAHGWPLSRGIEYTARQYLRLYPARFPRLQPFTKHFFEITLAKLASVGTRPVVVLSTYQPKLLKLVVDLGWRERHAEVLAYFKSLQKTYQFEVLDFSYISTFGGLGSEFYDGTHARVKLVNKMLDVVVKKAGALLQ